jgi:chemotaxis protein methyltransferase WspC
MDFYPKKIADILRDKIGLDCSTIGKSTVEKILMQRMMSCKIDTVENYYQYLISHQEELSELLEFAVIPETWFFRDIKPFQIIHQHIHDELLKDKLASANILSIPCSTGEEPYSIAMYLLDKGLPITSFNIDAVDISPRALELAKQGAYGNNSFRSNNYHDYQNKYFTQKDNFYQIQETINNKINFNRLNILQNDYLLHNKYDFILCRNLLIYFDTTTKERAFKNLSLFLKNTGLLFIGHSEFGSVPTDLFHNLGSSLSFALTKHNNPEHKKATSKENQTIKPKGNTPFKDKVKTKKTSFETYIQPSKVIPTTPAKDNLIDMISQAKNLANSAQYGEAEILCRRLIDEHGDNAEAFYILGLIASSQEQVALAESLFRKALFLEPKHYESCIYLSLLLQEKGDIQNAELFKKRADRSCGINQNLLDT